MSVPSTIPSTTLSTAPGKVPATSKKLLVKEARMTIRPWTLNQEEQASPNQSYNTTGCLKKLVPMVATRM